MGFGLKLLIVFLLHFLGKYITLSQYLEYRNMYQITSQYHATHWIIPALRNRPFNPNKEKNNKGFS